MRADLLPNLSVIFAQAVDVSPQNPWFVAIGALIGTGGLGALLGPYLKARADREKRAAEEDGALRRAKHEAELAQYDALTSMAKSMPAQFERMGERFERLAETMQQAVDKLASAQATNDRKVEANTAAVDALTAELFSENQVLVRAIAKQLGVQMQETTGPASVPAHVAHAAAPTPPVRPRLHSAPRGQ